MIDEIEAKCDLCKKPLAIGDTFELGKWLLHLECKKIAIERLTPFIDILFGPEDEWQRWLNDER